jgi:uncharacterized protein YjdB
MRLRHIVPAICSGVMLLACGFTEIFHAPQVGNIVLTYTGPTTLTVGDTVPVAVTVTVDGASIPNPPLFVTSDTSSIVISARSDTMIALSRGAGTLTIRYVASIFTNSYPTILQPVRVNP